MASEVPEWVTWPITPRKLRPVINIKTVGEIVGPNSAQLEQLEVPELSVTRQWPHNKQQDQWTCLATDVDIPAKCLIVVHSKSLDVGVPQYFVTLGPAPTWTPYEVQLIRATQECGPNELMVTVKPVPDESGMLGLLRLTDFNSTLQPRFCTFGNISPTLKPADPNNPTGFPTQTSNSNTGRLFGVSGVPPALAQESGTVPASEGKPPKRVAQRIKSRKRVVKDGPKISPSKSTLGNKPRVGRKRTTEVVTITLSSDEDEASRHVTTNHLGLPVTTVTCEWISILSYNFLYEELKARGLGLVITISPQASGGVQFEHFRYSNDVLAVKISHACTTAPMEPGQINVAASSFGDSVLPPTMIIQVGQEYAKWLLSFLGSTPFKMGTTNSGKLENIVVKLRKEQFMAYHEAAIGRNGVKRPSGAVADSNGPADGQLGTPPPKIRKSNAQGVSGTSISGPTPREVHKLLLRHSLEITNNDLLSLRPGKFLNDKIIEYWLNEIGSRLPEHIQLRTHILSTYFYNKLVTPIEKNRYSWQLDKTLTRAQKKHKRVQKWTKNVDLFSKDFIIVPIIEDSHWFLAVICFPGLESAHTFDDPCMKAPYRNFQISVAETEPNGQKSKVIHTRHIRDPLFKGSRNKVYSPEEITPANLPPIKQPCILIFDSLRNKNNHARVYSELRAYMQVEYLERKGQVRKFDSITMPGFQPSVPQQPNTWDCGIYLLKYVEMLLVVSLRTFAIPIPNMELWFSASLTRTKRKEIFDSIVERVKREAPEKKMYIPQIKF